MQTNQIYTLKFKQTQKTAAFKTTKGSLANFFSDKYLVPKSPY